MYKHRNEDSALTAVFGGLTLLTTGAWAFLLTYEYYPTLFFFEYPFLEKNIKLTMLIVSSLAMVSICTWLYLIYPSIKKRGETLNEMLEREASIRRFQSKSTYTEVIDDPETGQRTVTIRRDEE